MGELSEAGAMSEVRVEDNLESSRYELWVDEQLVSIADYVRAGDVLTVPHVETRPELRGRGNADRLMLGMLADIRGRGLRIRPRCSHALGYLRDHPADADLIA